MIKTSNKEFITLNEPMIYFYLIEYYFNKNGESFVVRFEDLIFSCVLLFFYEICVLLSNINFLSTNITEY